VAEHALRVVGKYALNLYRGIPAMLEQECKRMIAPPQ
jgi:hypothetical protein